MADKPTFTLGVEEEYHVVERDSGELIAACPPAMAEHFKREWGPRFSLELLQSQIEVMTLVHHSMGALRQELALLRRTAAHRGGHRRQLRLRHRPASTHPWAHWISQQHSEGARYKTLADNMQAVARRIERLPLGHQHVAQGTAPAPDSETTIEPGARL